MKKARKIVDVWITRDTAEGDEPDLLFAHAAKPTLDKFSGNWLAEVSMMLVPDVKPGKCKRLRLETGGA